MRYAAVALLLACMATMPLPGQEKTDGPQDEKAQKSYKEGMEFLKLRKTDAALDAFKKADKQDGGHCMACQKKMNEVRAGAGRVEDCRGSRRRNGGAGPG